MKFTRASLSYLGVVGAFALASRSAVRRRESRRTTVAVEVAARPGGDAAGDAGPGTLAPRLERVPTASAAPVQRQVKQLLNRGADVRKASEGFPNAYQFMTVAYAAKNTDIPFVVLKHRVLTEGKPLATAIAELKPELDGVAEVRTGPAPRPEPIWRGFSG